MGENAGTVQGGIRNQAGQHSDLFKGRQLRSTLVGVSLSSIGLVTFWGVHIYGKNALLEHARSELRDGWSHRPLPW